MRQVLLLVLALFSTNLFADNFQWNDKWTGSDKNYHFGIGLVTGASVTVLSQNANYGMAAGCAVGVAKEAYDLKKANHSATFQDLAVTCLGSVLGAQLTKNIYISPNRVSYVKQF